jgi:predicted dehydrogenase
MRHWAVIGTGNMAGLFVSDAKNVGNAQFIAVYSRDMSRAQAFAHAHGIEHTFDSMELMLADPAIDAVYIASPHTAHAAQAIQALNAGKHVLVEKPMALTQAEAQAVFDAAKNNQRFCAEALWTKFSHCYQALTEQLADGRIGELRHISANFGFAVDQSNPEHRLLNPDLAGGALLDIGLYPIFLPLALLGEPSATQAKVTMGPTGVDIATDLILEYDAGRSAHLAYRFDAMMPNNAIISGTKGWVSIETPFFASNALHWNVAGGVTQTEYHPMTNRGWGEEFFLVNEAIESGVLQASQHSWDDSLQLAGFLESLRKTYGPRYPFEG